MDRLKSLTLTVLICGVAADVLSAPYFNEVIPFVQSDGMEIKLVLNGDEFFAQAQTQSGLPVVHDKSTGDYCFATPNADASDWVSTGVRADAPVAAVPQQARANARLTAKAVAAKRLAGRRALRSSSFGVDGAPSRRMLGQRTPTSLGNVRGICLLVDFSDKNATVTTGTIDLFLNTPDLHGTINPGSVRDYFSYMSAGKLTYTNYVSPMYYRALHPLTYYTDSSVECGIRGKELVLEALNSLATDGLDLAQFDSNDDGLVDAVNCFYAGRRTNAWAEGLWPHMDEFPPVAVGNSMVDSYQISDLPDTGLSWRTFCHENGHLIMCWPDLYDYAEDGVGSNGLGGYCLMAYGDTPCAPLRHLAGWIGAVELPVGTAGKFAVESSLAADTYVRYNPLNPDEFFCIANYQTNWWDIYSAYGRGLAVYHVDWNGDNENQQMTPDKHYIISLEQADGLFHLEHGINTGDANDVLKAGGATEINDKTLPSLNWWSGAKSGLSISDVSGSGSSMSFTVGAGISAAECGLF